MKILNLVNLDKSDIKYKKVPFPDGQQNIIITGDDTIKSWLVYYNIDTIQIKSRLNNFQDLELIICAVKALRQINSFVKIHLYTPYFLGSRSDRKFEEGSCNYLKDVICPIINSLNLDSITVLDPHSDVLEACLNNFKKESNLELCWFALDSIYGKGSVGPFTDPNFILVSPDAGASKKIYKIAKEIGYDGNIITCGKDRDNNGHLTKWIIPYNDLRTIENYQKDIIIIDDICDGGATFINIVKEMIKQRKEPPATNFIPKFYLIVTHGIFSKGFEELNKYFDGIYCTNSYKNITFPHSMKGYLNRNSQQLNVF